MIEFHRIQKKKYQETFWNPAAKSQGRWNSLGTGIIYTAESVSLALLELSCWYGPIPVFAKNWVCASGTVGESFVVQVEDVYTMPENWRSFPHQLETRFIGDDWFVNQISAVLSVPSAVLNHSRNYLLNPNHPDFQEITFQEIEDLDLDPRLSG